MTANCVPIPFEPLKQLNVDPNKPIAYVMVSSSVGNMLTVERLTNKLGWPSPFTELKIGETTLSRTAYLRSPSLFSSKAHTKDISEAIFEWFEACHKEHQDIQIIPISVLWSRDPSIEGQRIRGIDLSTAVWRKFLTLTFAGRDNCTIISDPTSALGLEERLLTIENMERRKRTLNRLVAMHFLTKARSVVGKPFPNRKNLLRELVHRHGTQIAIAEEMERTGSDKVSLEKKAYEIFDVMVADTRYPLLRFFNCIISLIWKRIYHGQNIVGASKVRKLVQDGHEIIYIPCHRSHMDYILLLFAIFHEGLPIPQVASGDNLNFFPVGGIIRRCGSYFIRRKMKGDTFYTALFREYLSILFERGYATEFFIEGGRSRTGRTLPPRTGMVSMTVQAQLRGIERPITFIPTYLGYEHVMEVGSYMHELDGAKKKKESIWGLLGIFKRLRYYGRGYVTFGEPISIPRFLSQHVPDWHNYIDKSGNARPDWLYDTVNILSHEIIIKLNDSATVNGINLCAMALIGDSDHALSMNMLKRCLKLYLIVLSCDQTRRDLLPTATVDTLINQALELNKFKLYDIGDDMKFVRPSRGQTLQLTYFMNNILHLFALPALIASILIRNGHISRDKVLAHTRSLFYFLKHELFVPVQEEELNTLVYRYLSVFEQGGYITSQENNILTLSGDGYEELFILSNSIRLNLVRYLIAVTVLDQIENGTLNEQQFIKTCVELCHHVPSDVTNNSPEFADPIMFNIMCDTFVRHEYFFFLEDGTIKTNPAKINKLTAAATPLLAARLVRHLRAAVDAISLKRRVKLAEEEQAEAKENINNSETIVNEDKAIIINGEKQDSEAIKASEGATEGSAAIRAAEHTAAVLASVGTKDNDNSVKDDDESKSNHVTSLAEAALSALERSSSAKAQAIAKEAKAELAETADAVAKAQQASSDNVLQETSEHRTSSELEAQILKDAVYESVHFEHVMEQPINVTLPEEIENSSIAELSGTAGTIDDNTEERIKSHLAPGITEYKPEQENPADTTSQSGTSTATGPAGATSSDASESSSADPAASATTKDNVSSHVHVAGEAKAQVTAQSSAEDKATAQGTAEAKAKEAKASNEANAK